MTIAPSAQTAAVVIFSVLATLAMLLCILTGADPDDLADFYTGYRTLTPLTNGLAIDWWTLIKNEWVDTGMFGE